MPVLAVAALPALLLALLALAAAGEAHVEVLRPPSPPGGERGEQAEQGITVEGLAEAGGRRQYSCPARFVRMGNSCYFMSTFMAPWHEAHFRCRSLGAHLAAFEKRWENRNMRKFLMREELARLPRWIGGVYQWEKRFWMWGSSGLPVAYKAFQRRMVSRDWAWHCIAMDPVSDYHWRPASCFEVKHYICETPLRRSSTGKSRPPGPRGPSGLPAAGSSKHGSRPRRPGPGPGPPVEAADKQAGRWPSPTSSPGGFRNDTGLPAWRGRPSRPPQQQQQRPRTQPRRPAGHRGHRPPPPPAPNAPRPAPGAARHDHSPARPRRPEHAASGTPASLGSLPGPGSRWRPPSPPSLGLAREQMQMAAATVQALHPPVPAADDNDLSNNV